jgi:hypothetical protein
MKSRTWARPRHAFWCRFIASAEIGDRHRFVRGCAKGSPKMPVEFLHGRPLSPEEVEMLRPQIEEGFDNIAEVDER